ncbi:hypothetical protein NECAME_14484 [Necator americanus]|uniref:Uncharacterized protein n=1 Tax=Necator americanus TaxID=51031 RepID=W2SPT3_NECAM|nr:hypothetical protein NECAME_14484 [Necator americanus]ETN70861.1 hypothetical protein NECAME_14484 [Necator americanus]
MSLMTIVAGINFRKPTNDPITRAISADSPHAKNKLSGECIPRLFSTTRSEFGSETANKELVPKELVSNKEKG